MMSRPSFKDERGAKMSQLTINGQQKHGTAITFLIYGPHPYLIYYVLSSLPSPSHHARGKSSKLERKRPRATFPPHTSLNALARSLTHTHSLLRGRDDAKVTASPPRRDGGAGVSYENYRFAAPSSREGISQRVAAHDRIGSPPVTSEILSNMSSV